MPNLLKNHPRLISRPLLLRAVNRGKGERCLSSDVGAKRQILPLLVALIYLVVNPDLS